MKTRISRTPRIRGLTLPVLVPLLLLAQSDRPARLVLQPGSRLWIEGTSNLHDWRCEATGIKAEIAVQVRDAEGSSIPVAVEQVAVEIPVRGLRCGKAKMDENLYKALQADDNPTILFRVAARRVLPAPGATARVMTTLRGDLTAAGITKPIDLKVQAIDEGGGRVRISGSRALLITQFGIRPPTAMLGVLKTGNRFTVRFDLVTSTSVLAGQPDDGIPLLASGARTRAR